MVPSNGILHRDLYEDRLIKDDISFEHGRSVEEVGNSFFDTIHDRDRVGITTLLKYGDVDRVLSIYADDVGLELAPILRVTNICNLHRSVSNCLQGRSLIWSTTGISLLA